MIIEQIEMENFGPYRGSHLLQLGSGKSPLVVIHGQNMAGKTTILNAIRWGLYGKAKGRGKDEILKTRQLVNDGAFRDGERFVAVSLTVRLVKGDKTSRYVLTRRHQLREANLNGEDNAHYEHIKELKRDGLVLRPTDFDAAVNQSILPEGIARFFLFDGELLYEYEDLVREGGEAASRGVKEAIEMILGLPTARQGRDDVQQMRDTALRRLAKAAKEDGRATEARENFDRLEAERTRLKTNRDAVEDELTQARNGLRQVEEKLKLFEESREDAIKLDLLQSRIAEHERAEEARKAERREDVKDLWRDALAPKLTSEVARLEAERDERDTAREQLQSVESEIHRLQRSLDEETCAQCGQDLPHEQRAAARARLLELRGTAEGLRVKADVVRIRELDRVIGQMRTVAPARVVRNVTRAEEQIGEAKLARNKARREIEAIQHRLAGLNTAPMHEYDRERSRYQELMASAKEALGRLEEKMTANATQIQQARTVMEQIDSPRFRRLQQELKTLEALDDVFTAAVDELADELRQRVQVEASEIFKQLTTDPSYDGLAINDRYGLTIVREDGTEARQRSAGAEQVVALSLLGALNRLAVMRGPVIMDTPFGRLDRGHRANILRFAAEMADQVVLLVHDGEVDADRDLADIRGQVNAEYRIAHDAADNSRLVKVEVESHV